MVIISRFVTASTQNLGEIPVPPRTAITKSRAHASTSHVPLGTKISALSIPWVLAALSIRELGFPSPVIFLFCFGQGSLTPLCCGCAVVTTNVENPDKPIRIE
jgi:hypothetical protein